MNNTMTKEGILTTKDVVRSMIVETQNNLTKAEVTDRLFERANIMHNLDTEGVKRMNVNKQVIKQTRQMIKDLRDFLKDASDENPLADIFPQE